ncbi:Plant EC metallothionein-like protein [Theobroma cacao]|uniref:Plant EC metallothionein-like protein, putative n=1 Tax=Theobroma cacao TaxID=3641 RepID=A0A061E1H0_THECC|nr:Plant EC metallothionein-like protein, putative [Theobroma cacao]WRX14765.1 Plant EC metallothionein-like protein [Theobroma cacao]
MDLKDSKRKVNVLKAKGIGVACDERCGCPSPCPGGVACRCASGDTSEVDGHRRCSCGEHCSCNPCSCTNAVAGTGIGKAFCKCGELGMAVLALLVHPKFCIHPQPCFCFHVAYAVCLLTFGHKFI